jgi:hypothetical protein
MGGITERPIFAIENKKRDKTIHDYSQEDLEEKE